MKPITRSELTAIIAPADVIAVEYLKKDEVARLISKAEGKGEATHALCCLGTNDGLDLVEACITGVTESNLRNYLRGNCQLTIRRAYTAPSPSEAKRATDFWLARVNERYDLPMIVGCIPILFAKHVIGFFSEAAGDWCLQHMPNLLASSNLSTCAELAVRGLREFSLIALFKYPVENIDPELLRTDPSLITKTVLDGAVLID